MRNLHIDNGYTRTITVYVPLDYSCENYEINMNFGSISKDSFPANIQNLTVSVDAGEAVFDIDSSIDHFEGDVDAGQMTITTNGPINHMDLQCDLGEIVLVSNAAIDTLNIDVDAGAIDFTGKSTVSKADISTNLGEFSGTFYGRVGKMEASVDLGSINLHLHANDDSTAHVDVDLGDIDCDLPIVKSDKNPTFDLTANLGSITVVSE